MQPQRLLDDPRLADDASRVESGARTGDGARRQGEQRGDDRGRGGGVADAHVAADVELRVRGMGAFGAVDTGPQRSRQLVVGHRRPGGEIARAGRDARVDDARTRRVAEGADIDHFEGGAEFPRQHADGRAASYEIAQHRRRHGLRIGRHAAGGDAVIGGKHRDVHAVEPWRRRPLETGEADCQ